MKKVYLNKEFLEQKILEMNISKGDIAKRLNCSQCLFSLHLNGHISLRPARRIKFMKFFNANFDDLFLLGE